MTEATIADFRLKFKNIIWLKHELHKANAYIGAFTHYDRNGSHQNAILKSINIKDEIKKKYYDALGTKTYEQWMDRSKIITKYKNKIKVTKRPETKEAWANKLLNLPEWKHEKIDFNNFVSANDVGSSTRQSTTTSAGA